MAEAPGAAPAAPAGGAPAAGSPDFLGGTPAAPAAPGGAAAPPTNPYAVGDWRHTLPEDIRSDESLKLFNDVPTLAKSYVHARKQIGADKVALPSKHATPEDHQAFYDALGRPKLEEYKPNIPKDSKFVSPELVGKLAPIAHKAGIMPAQLEAVLGFYESEQATAAVEQTKALETSIKAGMDGLKTEWGKAFDQRAQWAKRYVDEHGTPALKEFFKENRAASWNPELIKILAKAGEATFKEDGITAGPGGGNLLDPSQALQKYNSIIMDMKHPYNLVEHPNHDAAVKEVHAIFEMAYPKTEAS